MYNGLLIYKDRTVEVDFKTKPSFQTIMFDKMGGNWLPLEIIFKNKKERDGFIKNEPSSIVLEDLRDEDNCRTVVFQSWNIHSIKQFTYKGNKSVILHFNACFNNE